MLRLVVDGRTSKEIARLLGISDLTVRKHREHLLRKLGLRSTAQLLARPAVADRPAAYDIGSIHAAVDPPDS